MEKKEPLYTNRLIHENSPYLLQHAHNPVNWYPWGEEALNKARSENKLIIVSIGYAACHWCHVMEHESFEDEKVAEFMNEHFISVKVDREERPDIDQIYMTAVQLITRRGGWPLNCITLPDGRPVYGGTYFPKKQWLELLYAVLKFVKEHPDKAEETAKSLVSGVSYEEVLDLNGSGKSIDDELSPPLDSIFHSWEPNLDFFHGGTVGAPKFPMPDVFQLLLYYYYLTKNKRALNAVVTTLDKMANGGIYDQLGGGFARYSTDEHWKVPHFEKMLYDNAQLVSLYSSAYQLIKNQKYKWVIEGTLDFIERELTSPEGGFYSSFDADSEGTEGKFYVWTADEIEESLGNDAPVFMDYFNVTHKGNWENSFNILNNTIPGKDLAHKFKLTEQELEKKILISKEILFKKRAERISPALDDKIITSWNGLMIKAYADAYRALGNTGYLKSALQCAELITNYIRTEQNQLFRIYKKGKTSINAFLDDYAFTISAFISLYQTTFNEHWIKRANELLIYALNHFYDLSSGMFYYSSDTDSPMIARKMEIHDNVIPASNSEMAKNLFLLGHYLANEDYIGKSKKMLDRVTGSLSDGGIYYSNWDIFLALSISEPFETAILGEDCDNLRKQFDQYYLPNIIFMGGKEEGTLPLLKDKLKSGQTTIYVCRNKVCQMPVTQVDEALKQIG